MRPFLPCFGDEARQRAEQAMAVMAPAALQLVLLPRYPAFRVSALLSLVALQRAVRGQSASANAAPLSVQGLSFALSRLGTVTEGIFRSWRAVPSWAVQAFALRQL